MSLRIGSLLFVVCVWANICVARWDKVLSTRDSIWIGRTLELRSGYFFDELTGFVGAGSGTDLPLIFTTTDGGASWGLAITPINGNGVVSSFFFRNRQQGYATVHKTSFPSSSIWSTTDGGLTWIDITGSRTAFEHTCIYETSKALIVTSWDRTGGKGGFSTDGGTTWTEVFANAADHSSNGIGFVDDLHGLVTMGPASLQPSGNNAYATSDGGLSWKKVHQFNEAWSVYGLKGTSTFFLAPEGDIAGGTGDRQIYRSDDYGQSFQVINQFPQDIQFVGHIDGVANTLYLQTRKQSKVNGLFRSDDLGARWIAVGGPSNVEDSRFVVTGCAGQVVYAFDNSGNVWKTSDGGDGTLTAQSSPRLTLSKDTLLLGSLYCNPVSAASLLQNFSCDTLVVETLDIVGDSLGEFSLSTRAPVTVAPQRSQLIEVTFTPRSSGPRQVGIRLTGKKGPFNFDTTITVLARNQLAPELFIPQLPSVKANEQLVVPIYISPATDTFTISRYNLKLAYNGDVVFPAREDAGGTLSEGGTLQLLTEGNNALKIIASLSTPITEASDLTKPLIRIVMNTYLSSSLATTIEIDSFGTPTLVPRCAGAGTIQSMLTIDPECGDSLLSSFMRTNTIAGITSVVPNPTVSGKLEVVMQVNNPCTLSLAVLDLSGRIIKELLGAAYKPGVYSEQVHLTELAGGTYYLCLRDGLTLLSTYQIQLSK